MEFYIINVKPKCFIAHRPYFIALANYLLPMLLTIFAFSSAKDTYPLVTAIVVIIVAGLLFFKGGKSKNNNGQGTDDEQQHNID
jgi:hypothetical protein